MILAGDIGGTKTNLALFESVDNQLKMKVKHQFSSREFNSFNDVLSEFDKLTSCRLIDAACFGIAGPIIQGRCITTNLPWEISTSDLQKHLDTEKVRLMNDLEATAYGMLYLKDDEFVDLNPEANHVQGNCAVIAAGTGLGEAMLYFDGEDHHPFGSEGGHTDFAPVSSQQDALLGWMRIRYPEHVSYERILSGPGISDLYDFLHESGFAPQPAKILQLKADADKSAMISACALNDEDPLCRETLRLFSEIYGAEAGNLALKSMALGGVYVGGGIAPKILPFLLQEDFMKAFVNKGRFENMLRAMHVKVSLNQETALLGAANFAVNRL